MGCNCKQNKETIDKAIKHSDEGENFYLPTIFGTIIKYILQFAIAAIAVSIMAVLAVPALLYIVVCLSLGKEPSFRLINLNKRINARKQKLQNKD